MVGGSVGAVPLTPNLLTHGNISLSECGLGYIHSDLKKYKEDILEYLDDVIKVTKTFIDNRNYKKL